jgi:hypothetical protein
LVGEEGEDLPVTGEEWFHIAVDMVRGEEWRCGLLVRRRRARIAHRTSVRADPSWEVRPSGRLHRRSRTG